MFIGDGETVWTKTVAVKRTDGWIQRGEGKGKNEKLIDWQKEVSLNASLAPCHHFFERITITYSKWTGTFVLKDTVMETCNSKIVFSVSSTTKVISQAAASVM